MKTFEVTSLRVTGGTVVAVLEAPSGSEWTVYKRGDGKWVDSLNRDGALLLPDVMIGLDALLEATE